MSVPRFPRPQFTKKACGKIRGYSETLQQFAESYRQEIYEVAQEVEVGHCSPENNTGGTLATRTHVRLDRQKNIPGGTANLAIQANIARNAGSNLAGLIVPAAIVRIARSHSQTSVSSELKNVMVSALMLSSRTGDNYMIDLVGGLNAYITGIVKEISRITPGNHQLHPDYRNFAALLVELQKNP